MKYRRQSLSSEQQIRAKRRRGAIAVLPTLFTLGNCISGFASMHYAAKGIVAETVHGVGHEPVSNFAIAGYLIFLAMIFDVFDGFVARLAKATSDFGGELDSLADVISFGVAPAFLTLQLISAVLAKTYLPTGAMGPYEFLGPDADDRMGKLFWIIGAIYVACTALRLARFNVFNKHEEAAHMAFRGLPSPGAAGVVASSVLFFESLHSTHHFIPPNMQPPQGIKDYIVMVFPYVMPVVLLAAALLMVSRFTYSHLINRYLRGRRGFSYVVRVAILLLLTLWQPQITALLVIYIYALSAPVTWLWRTAFHRGEPALAERPVEPEGEIGQ